MKVSDHSRDSAGLRYVYPVISRRAGGVSVGINVNINNACNWRCIYCQVPGLTLGMAPEVDMDLLEDELSHFMAELLTGKFMSERVPEDMRRINDIALSGNGEPTSSKELPEIIELIASLKLRFNWPDTIKLILITNGSLIHRPYVQKALRIMSGLNGEVWFKVDRASNLGMRQINDTRAEIEKVKESVANSVALCTTWLQTCWFSLDGKVPSLKDEDDYIELLLYLKSINKMPRGVLLYTVARPSLQPEAQRIAALTGDQMSHFADRIRGAGLEVKVSL